MISVGIDVSKGKSMVCVMKPYGEIVASPYIVNHTEKELESLTEIIFSLEAEVKVVMEATGAYHLPVLGFLLEREIFVSVINPLVMKKYASIALRKGKTDKIDSARIANFGLDNWLRMEPNKPDEEIYGELKILGRQYSHYIKIQIQNKLALTNILDRTMPGIKKMLHHDSNATEKDKLADFVERYCHYDNITKMTERKFVESYNKWAKKKGYHQSESKAKKIYALAKDGISTLSSNMPSTKMLVLESIGVLKKVSKTLVVILSHMERLAKDLKEYETVLNMQGVGDILAVRLIAEIGDVRRFHSGKALIAYAGIDSPPYESGGFIGTKRGITKRGSSLLRKTGYEVMKCLKTVKPTEDAAVYEFILKKESEGKAKKVAKIAGLNKFLRIYYARVIELYQE